MDRKASGFALNNPDNAITLKMIFDKSCMEMISDDQIKRLLEPILKMIHDGRFN